MNNLYSETSISDTLVFMCI